MNVLDLLFSPKGTIKPQLFAVVAISIYTINFLAGSVLNGQFVMRAGLWAYVGMQILLIWIWFVVHKKRLADAGKGYAVAASLAFIYLVGVAFFASFAAGTTHAAFDQPDSTDSKVSLFGVIIAILFINTLFSGDFFLISLFIFLIIGLPLLFALIVVIYSIVTGARASAAPEPPAAPPPPDLPVPEPATPLPGSETSRSPFA